MIDTIIVGCGISGLNIATHLKKNVILFDKNSYIGGRIRTVYLDKTTNYEAGAGRINKNNKRLMKLLTKYNLKQNLIKIKSDYDIINTKNEAIIDPNSIIDKLITLYNKKSNQSYLKSLTLYDLTKQVFNEHIADTLYHYYPYYSEINVINAYDGLKMMSNDLHINNTYYVLNGGLTTLTDAMTNEILGHKNKFNLNHELKDVIINNKDNTLSCFFKNLKNNKILKYQCNKLILACDAFSLQKMPCLKKFNIHNLLNSVKCQPLLRTYAIYKNEWFKDLNKVVSNEKIKYIIPINPKTGLIMISYTDGIFAEYWKKQIKNNTQKKNLNKQLNKLFLDLDIPKQYKIMNCYWEDGAAYWKPNINSSLVIKKITKPTKHDIYICNDSFSNHQAWIEGALESSENVINSLL